MSNPEPNSTENTTQLPIEFLCKLIPREFNGNRYEVGQFLADCNNAYDQLQIHKKLPYYIIS